MQSFLHRDGTVTMKDILSAVASISYSKSQHQRLRPGGISRSRMLQTMKAARHKTNTTQRILSLMGEVFARQESLIDVECASVEHMEWADMFASDTVADIDDAVKAGNGE
jgi:hypothetical protein